MTDPLFFLIRTIFDAHVFFAGTFGRLSPIINVLFVLMALLLLKTNLSGYEERKLDKRYSDICGTLINRINKLSSLYIETNYLYAKAQMRALTGNKRVVQCIRSIPKDIKSKAERDFCLQDVNRPENLAVLQEQLQRLLEEESDESVKLVRPR